MSIVSHIIESGAIQLDGRLSIVERYMRGDGSALTYLAEVLADQDLAAWATARIAAIEAADTANEIASNVADVTTNGSLASPTLLYSTAAANFAALRAAYLIATRVEAIMIGDFLSTLTNAQLQAAFGLTAGQVTTLRSNKLTPAATLAASIRATTGA